MSVQSRLARLEPLMDDIKSQALTTGINAYMGYRRNYALIQRILQVSYFAFIIGSTYRGLNPKPKKRATPAKAGEDLKKSTSSAEKDVTKAKEAISDEGAVVDMSGGASGRGKRKGRGPRVEVDAKFFEQLRRIMRIIIPSWRSKEAMLLAGHSCFWSEVGFSHSERLSL